MLVTVKEVVSVQYADDVVAQILSVGLEVKSSVAARNAYEVAFVSRRMLSRL